MKFVLTEGLDKQYPTEQSSGPSQTAGTLKGLDPLWMEALPY